MLQNCYINAVDKAGFEALGIRLAPLTLYHCRVLDCMASPYMRGGPIGDDDVVLFVSVCAHATRADVDGFLHADQSRPITQIIIDAEAKDFDAAREAVEKYFDYYTARPARTESHRQDRTRAPWWGMMKSHLTENAGYTNDEAWNCVVCEAFAEAGWYSARHGDESIVDDFALELEAAKERGDYVPPTQEELKARMFGGPAC